MSKKILFFDIDGTLLDGKAGIPDSAMRALKQAQENGHYLFINSGRTSGFLPKAVREFPFDGYLCGCGIEIIFHDESIYHNAISKETSQKVLDALKVSGVQALLEGADACYCDQNNENLFQPLKDLCAAYEGAKVVSYPMHDMTTAEEMDYDKFVAFYDDSCDYDTFAEMIKDDFTIIEREPFSGYHFVEVVPAGHSKATGMDYIANHLGLSMEESYAFGDSTNDLAMLSHARHSIAMGNSFPEVFPLVNYVTTPINRDGIELALKHYRLI